MVAPTSGPRRSGLEASKPEESMKMRAVPFSATAAACGVLILAFYTAEVPSAQTPRPAANPSCTSPANKIVAENCKPGNPRTEWDINSSGDPSIQGFATEMSVNAGETVNFKIRTHSPKYRIDVYRMGWYGGNGARRVVSFRPTIPLP